MYFNTMLILFDCIAICVYDYSTILPDSHTQKYTYHSLKPCMSFLQTLYYLGLVESNIHKPYRWNKV